MSSGTCWQQSSPGAATGQKSQGSRIHSQSIRTQMGGEVGEEKKKRAGIVIFAWEALPWKPWNKNLNFKIDKDWFRWHGIITYTPSETGSVRAYRCLTHKGEWGGRKSDYSTAISLLLWKRYGESLLFHQMALGTLLAWRFLWEDKC